MKKFIAFILSHVCFYIGDAFCKVSFIKRKGEFLIDKPLFTKILGWAHDNYQRFMHYSLKIQDWGGNDSPWNKVSND